jgi:hypothetical protein
MFFASNRGVIVHLCRNELAGVDNVKSLSYTLNNVFEIYVCPWEVLYPTVEVEKAITSWWGI